MEEQMDETRTQSDRDTLKSKAINWRKKRSNVDKNSWTQQKRSRSRSSAKSCWCNRTRLSRARPP